LAAQEPSFLIANFGKSTGAWMHEAAWGRDDRPVETTSEPVSMSRETTFDRDLHAVRDRAELGEIFTRLCMKLGEDLQRKGYVAKTIGIKLRYDDFKIATRDQTMASYTSDGKTIRTMAGVCLKRVALSQKLRLLGVRASTLLPASQAAAAEKAEESPISERKSPLAKETPAQAATDLIASDQLF
jgi:DNA polymerase IV